MREINFALVGCGKIAERHIEAIQLARQAKLIAVCDSDPVRAQDKSRLGQVPAYSNYHDMLAAHPAIDVVTLLTPSGVHFEQGMDIISQYQKHLLIEKPFIMTISQGVRLKEAADAAKVSLFPLYQHRFNQSVQCVKNALKQDGALGKLRVGTVRVRWCRQQAYYDLSPWRGTWAMDGGAFTNQGIHYIDLLRYLGGEVKQVHAKMATLGAAIEVEDTGVAILEFKSGALGVIEIMTSARPDDFEASISCVCENGLAVIAGAATNKLDVFTPDTSQTALCSEIFPNGYGFGHNAILQNVADTLLMKKPPLITFEDGFQSIQLLHALYKSDEVNGWVNVDEAHDSSRLGLAETA